MPVAFFVAGLFSVEYFLGVLLGQLDVLFVLEDEVQRVQGYVVIDRLLSEQYERPFPVQRFADAGLFLELQGADFMHGCDDAARELLLALGHLQGNDLLLEVPCRIIDGAVGSAVSAHQTFHGRCSMSG